MTIIALSGKAGSGKDSFADLLVNRYEFTKIAIADPLRQLCSKIFSIPITNFTEHGKKDEPMGRIHLDFHDIDKIRHYVTTEFGYEIDEEARFQMEELHGRELDTPRDILRCVGNMLRDNVDQDIWINLALNKIKNAAGRIIITDARFENEREVFRRLGALLILIKRNDNGSNSEHEFNLGSDDEYDVVFTNNSTLHAYLSSVDMWYNTRKNELELYKVWKYE